MTRERFAHLLAAYGGKLARWPEAEQAAARALLERSAEARAQLAEAQRLDVLLDRIETTTPSAELTARVLAAAPRRIGARRLPSGRRTRLAAVAGTALAASLAWWLVRAPAPAPSLGTSAMARLGVLDVPTDALLSDVDVGLADEAPAFGCDDPALGCEESEPGNRSGALGPTAKEVPA